MFDLSVWSMIGRGVLESLYMTLVSTFFAYLFGLPLGIIMVVTDKDGIYPRRTFNWILGLIINILRSVPFLILLVVVIPVTRFIVGTTLGSTATIVPLVISAAPFIARLVESSMKEVDKGVIEAAQSMG
ncbi:MAG: ABC transporter permease subunit, partial [Clostridiales bacterium]|nr:ABC transporter permease subunit [Clostridiales bacterium]